MRVTEQCAVTVGGECNVRGVDPGKLLLQLTGREEGHFGPGTPAAPA